MVVSIFLIILEYDIVLSYNKIVDTHVIFDVECNNIGLIAMS